MATWTSQVGATPTSCVHRCCTAAHHVLMGLDDHITADGAMEFFTSRRKVTTKWSMRGTLTGDRANFDAVGMGKL